MDNRFVLPANTIVDGGYCIVRVVGSGGFGVTYEAEDIHLSTRVALKEYYPFDYGDRDATMSVRPKSERHKTTFEWGRSSFLREARMLAQFRHPSIVRVTRVFEANSTAYMVMDFEEGQSLEAWLRRLGRAPTQEELDRIAAPLLDALELMHRANFLHRDIAPDNVIVRADGSPVLLDFGAARRALAEMSRSLTGIVKPGYSPHEQYSSDARLQGPWSDIYALGGTLYRAVTGTAPEEATLRVDLDRMPPASRAAKGRYRKELLQAIDACLKVKGADRPQSIPQLRPMLLAREQQKEPAPFATTRKIDARQSRSLPFRQSGRWMAVGAILIAIVGGSYGAYEFTHWQPAQQTDAAAAAGQTAENARHQAELDAARQQRDATMQRSASGKLLMLFERKRNGARKKRRRGSRLRPSVSARKRWLRKGKPPSQQRGKGRKKSASLLPR